LKLQRFTVWSDIYFALFCTIADLAAARNPLFSLALSIRPDVGVLSFLVKEPVSVGLEGRKSFLGDKCRGRLEALIRPRAALGLSTG
jgi:hypothetical protein